MFPPHPATSIPICAYYTSTIIKGNRCASGQGTHSKRKKLADWLSCGSRSPGPNESLWLLVLVWGLRLFLLLLLPRCSGPCPCCSCLSAWFSLSLACLLGGGVWGHLACCCCCCFRGWCGSQGGKGRLRCLFGSMGGSIDRSCLHTSSLYQFSDWLLNLTLTDWLISKGGKVFPTGSKRHPSIHKEGRCRCMQRKIEKERRSW